MNVQTHKNAPKYSINRVLAIIPLIVLALVSLLGNTYRFHTMAKVQAGALTHGAFPILVSLAQVRVTSEEAIPIVLPDVLDGKLSATSVSVGQGEVVIEGQTLLTYNKQQTDQLLVETKILVIEAQEAIYQFDIGFSDASIQAEEALDEAIKVLERAKKQKNNRTIPKLQKDFDQRQHEFDILTKSGYFMGTTRATLQWRLDCVVKEQEELALIAANNYKLTSPQDGYVMQSVTVIVGAELKAGVALYMLLPNDAKYQIELPLPDDVKIQIPSSNAQLTLFNEADRSKKLTVTFTGEQKPTLMLRPGWEGLMELTQLKSYILQLSSPFYPLMAPKEIFDENGMIYLLKPTPQEHIYTVSKLNVETEKGNDKYIPLRGGFPADALFILYPNHNILSGTLVFLLPD